MRVVMRSEKPFDFAVWASQSLHCLLTGVRSHVEL